MADAWSRNPGVVAALLPLAGSESLCMSAAVPCQPQNPSASSLQVETVY